MNYLPAAEYLANRGIYAIRMGYMVEKELPMVHPKIIDYASQHRTDFGDIYLVAKCKFYLAAPGGLQSLPWVFHVPMAYANTVPIKHKPLRKGDIFIPSKLWDRKTSRLLTFREQIDSGAEEWFDTSIYAKYGIDVIENTEDEILDLAKEIDGRLNGTWIYSKEDERLQSEFRELWPSNHISFGFPSRIGSSFLSENRELLG